jgi:hypothetical protein
MVFKEEFLGILFSYEDNKIEAIKIQEPNKRVNIAKTKAYKFLELIQASLRKGETIRDRLQGALEMIRYIIPNK